MSYQALYRKYRPQTFSEVIGQDHITTILKNQIRDGHTSHAYLFAGTRGTGKTTTARIFARAVNCLESPEGEPCGSCPACTLSAAGNADIIELDAASNSGVDDIRALVEKARFLPLELKTKVYIIDEAHALAASGQSFNALLKTLEEPPAHVIFILATTEPQKLPATIISRCQRFDFHRLRVEDMVALMREVLQKSGASIEEEGLLAIARAAEGGMRDALSLADQCVSFCGERVSAADVYNVLGSMDSGFLFTMADALIDGRADQALRLLDEVVKNGRDLPVFAHDLAQHMRALLISKLCGRCADILDCTEDAMKRYLEQCSRCGEKRLLGAVETLMQTQANLRWLTQPRVLIESALVRVAQPEEARSLNDLTERLEALEQKLAALQATPAAQPAAPPARGAQPVPPQAEDIPPWEEAPRDAPPPDDRDAPPEPPQDSAPVPRTKPKAKGPLTPDQIWKEVIAGLKTQEQLAYAMALKGKGVSLENGVFSVGFEQEIYSSALNNPDYRKLINSLLSGVIGDHTLQFVTLTDDSAEKQAKALFGDALRIVD